MKKSIRINMILLVLIVSGVIFVAIAIIPNTFYIQHPKFKTDSVLKMNMHNLQIAADSFSILTGGHYPADLNITVQVSIIESGIKYNRTVSIAGTSKRDTIFAYEIGSFCPSLLLTSFKNPYDESKPILITSRFDPPVWNNNYIGVVYYVPLEIKDNIAKGYKIYGASKNGFLSLVLCSVNKKVE